MPGWNFEKDRGRWYVLKNKRQGTGVCLEKQARPDNADALYRRCISLRKCAAPQLTSVEHLCSKAENPCGIKDCGAFVKFIKL